MATTPARQQNAPEPEGATSEKPGEGDLPAGEPPKDAGPSADFLSGFGFQRSAASSHRELEAGLRVVAFVLYAFVAVQRGWLCDDAFISMRSVDHFVGGHGLVFNVGDRVQSFTNPLWVLLLSLPHALVGEPYQVLLLTSLVTSLLAAGVLAWLVAPRPLAGALGLTLLALSEAAGDFATSGLENPLSHLLVLSSLAFLLHPARWAARPRAPWLCAGLAVTTRMDNGVILAPALVVLAAQQLRIEHTGSLDASAGALPSARKAGLRLLGYAAIGFAPFLAWELFALVYYGSLVPNTAIAKLGVSLPRGEVLGQGLTYLLTSFERDPITPLTIAAAVVLGVRHRLARPVAIGLALHVAYVVWVGGDFMAGRFFSLPLVTAAALLAWQLGTAAATEPDAVAADPASAERLAAPTGPVLPLVYAACVGVAVAVLSPYDPLSVSPPPNSKNTLPPTGVVSERAFYLDDLGIVPNLRSRAFERHAFWQHGVRFRNGRQRVVRHNNAGLAGYAAGPKRHLVDGAGLTDALLARVPFEHIPDWRIGHYGRRIPKGYLESLESGKNQIEDQHYRTLYDKLQLVTRGPLLRWERFAAIYDLHVAR